MPALANAHTAVALISHVSRCSIACLSVAASAALTANVCAADRENAFVIRDAFVTRLAMVNRGDSQGLRIDLWT